MKLSDVVKRKAGHFINGLFILSAGLFLMTGCGKTGGEQDLQDGQSAAEWKEKGFALSGPVENSQAFWVERYVPWSGEELPYDRGSEEILAAGRDVCLNGKAYRLYTVSEQGSLAAKRFLLDIYDTNTMERTLKEYSPEELGIEKQGEYSGNMDVLGEQSYALHIMGYSMEDEQLRLVSDRIMYFGEESEKASADVLPVYLEKGIASEFDDALWLSGDCFCDQAGNSYVRPADMSGLYILDPSGKLLTEYKCDEGETVGAPMKTEDGELIFTLHGENERICMFDLESGQLRVLAKLEDEFVGQLYGMQGQYLYYEGSDGIVRWDVVSGTRQLVLDFVRNGIASRGQYPQTMLLFRQGKPPVLRVYDGMSESDNWLAVLSEEPTETGSAVRIACLETGCERVKTSAVLAGKLDRNYIYSVEEPDSLNAGDFRDRIMAELASGGGPDILYVSRRDAGTLQEKGYLGDLSRLVPEETLNSMIPAAVQLGTVDGVLVGVPAGITARSLMVGRDVFEGDTWTLDEMLELMEDGNLEGRILMNSKSTYYAPLAVVRTLVNYSLEDSFLIDWENRESHFEDERFVKLLECAGKYSGGAYDGQMDERAFGGASLPVEVCLWSPRDIGEFCGSHGAESSHYVGFPTDSGNGNYLDTDGLLVVKSEPENPEAVSLLLECLLGSRVQGMEDYESSAALPVTYFPEDQIRYDDDGKNAWWGEYALTVFEDGSTSLEAANDFLSQCVPAPEADPYLDQIITEELTAYYEEKSRTAEATADVIDRRIQVYLDEE